MIRKEYKSVHNINGVTVSVLWNHNNGSMNKFSVPKSITEKEAVDLQMELGYHPSGYGFYSFDPTLSETTWKCADNCD